MAGITVTVKPAANLRSMMEDLPGEIRLTLDEPAPASELVRRAGIPPVMVYRIVSGRRVVEGSELIDRDAELHVIAPMSGG